MRGVLQERAHGPQHRLGRIRGAALLAADAPRPGERGHDDHRREQGPLHHRRGSELRELPIGRAEAVRVLDVLRASPNPTDNRVLRLRGGEVQPLGTVLRLEDIRAELPSGAHRVPWPWDRHQARRGELAAGARLWLPVVLHSVQQQVSRTPRHVGVVARAPLYLKFEPFSREPIRILLNPWESQDRPQEEGASPGLRNLEDSRRW